MAKFEIFHKGRTLGNAIIMQQGRSKAGTGPNGPPSGCKQHCERELTCLAGYDRAPGWIREYAQIPHRAVPGGLKRRAVRSRVASSASIRDKGRGGTTAALNVTTAFRWNAQRHRKLFSGSRANPRHMYTAEIFWYGQAVVALALTAIVHSLSLSLSRLSDAPRRLIFSPPTSPSTEYRHNFAVAAHIHAAQVRKRLPNKSPSGSPFNHWNLS
ncbi:hypothetical protein NA57DRAFT_57428 [Rhizodiscina lignyota]|uniref:Uncharacterized protein n=1 Tax=Rhizodiscina lignyota TaxID=1504668 RepID=A0A9P4IFP7_9PEZI|nr:hypothetical protein NA57DRAFT_57428 [Rhizodiscina lignyota]